MVTLYQQIGPEQLGKLVDSFYNLVFASEKIGPLFLDSDKELVKKISYYFLLNFLVDLFSSAKNLVTQECVCDIFLTKLTTQQKRNGYTA